MLSGDECTDIDKDSEDEENGELGAVEALTQLRPRNTILVSPEGNRVINEPVKGGNYEGSLRCQIKRGIRSVRRANVGHVSRAYSNGTSPKGPSNKCTQNLSRRKILNFYDKHQESVEPNRAAPDFSPTKRSSRMNSRRKRKFTELSTSDNSRALIRSNTGLKLPRDMKGRWATERYKSAQLKLIDIMHRRGAAPGKPILRLALREEARKDIGDTGLLDHLLKHMTDTIIANGERFRRRHNSEGAMEYWLEEASLMEIRKAAKIEDPSWIPPPGWKPGDALPGRGCFKEGMTPAEVSEIKKLKETVNKVRSDLQCLSAQVKRSRSRESRTPVLKDGSEEGLEEDKYETTAENNQEEGSPCKISTEAKSQLEIDLSDVQKSVIIIQDYVHLTMMGLGLLKAEPTKLTSAEGMSGATESSSRSNCQLSSRDATSAPVYPPCIDLDTTNCFSKISLPADINHRMSSVNIDSNKLRLQVDSSISCGNEPSRLDLSRSISRAHWAVQDEVKTFNAPASRYFELGGMTIPQRGAFSAWTEGVISPGTPPATSIAPHLGPPATSREDASARVLYSIKRSDSKDQFKPNFPHHVNLSSTDSALGKKSQETGHRPEHNRVQWMTAGGQLQPTCIEKPEAHASVWVQRKPAKAVDIECVPRNQVSTISNLTVTSNSFVGFTSEYSSSITVCTEATPCRSSHQGQTNHLPMRSGLQYGHICEDLSQSYVQSVTAAQCDTHESFKLPPVSFSTQSYKILANPSKDSGCRAEHLAPKPMSSTPMSRMPPTAHMAYSNFSLTSHRSPKPSYISSPSTSKIVSGGMAEESLTCGLGRVFAASGDGRYGNIVPLYGSKSANEVDCLKNIDGDGQKPKQKQAPGEKHRLEGGPTTQTTFHENVFETRSKPASSAWLGLAPPNTTNLCS